MGAPKAAKQAEVDQKVKETPKEKRKSGGFFGASTSDNYDSALGGASAGRRATFLGA